MADLRDLTFPYAGDATDVFTLTTGAGTGYVDQGTGEMLAWQAPGPWTVVGEWIYLLHTGDGAALWGLILGLAALTVPVLSVTGGLIWWRNRQSRPRLAGMVAASVAETVILVGSEGGTHLGLCRSPGPRLARPWAGRASGRPLHLCAADLQARQADCRHDRDLGRWRCADLGQGRAGAAGDGRPAGRGAAGGAGLRRPQLSRLLRLCRSGGGRRESRRLGHADAAGPDRPAIAAGLCPLVPRLWRGDRPAPGHHPPTRCRRKAPPCAWCRARTMAKAFRPPRRSCALPCRRRASGTG